MANNNIRIFKATPADAAEMIQVWKLGAKTGNWSFICSKKCPTKADIESLKRELAKRKPTQVRFLARNRKTGQVVGTIAGSWRTQSRMSHVVSCGWGVHPDFQRQGVGTALLETLVNYVRGKGFKRIEAEIATENIASLRLAKRLGFVQEGVKRAAFMTDDGRLIDLVIMGLVL